MTKDRASKPDDDESEDSLNVTLPPIDATPEEIAQALVRAPPPRRPDTEESGSPG